MGWSGPENARKVKCVQYHRDEKTERPRTHEDLRKDFSRHLPGFLVKSGGHRAEVGDGL